MITSFFSKKIVVALSLAVIFGTGYLNFHNQILPFLNNAKVTLSNSGASTGTPAEPSKYHGYIVEYKDSPAASYSTAGGAARKQLSSYIQTIKQKQDVAKTNIASWLGISKASLNQKITRNYAIVFNGSAMNISDQEAEKIKNSPYVKAVYPNYEVKTLLNESVPLIQADRLWARGVTGKGVTVGIIDTGVDYTHPDLGGCLGPNCKVIGGYDFVNNDSDPMDDMGHGTHVAATIAGNNDTLKGVAPEAKIVAYKVLDSGGSGTTEAVMAGIERSADPNQDGNISDHLNIISLSLGSLAGSPFSPDAEAIDSLTDLGVVAVIAAGNSGPGASTIGSPGTSRKAITVGAADKSDRIADFSSRGPVNAYGDEETSNDLRFFKPDVVAPGVLICAAQSSQDTIWQIIMNSGRDSHCFDDTHIAISGTSMATPHVSGLAALILQMHPDWTPEEVKSAIKISAESKVSGDSNTGGAGRINAFLAGEINYNPPVASILNYTDYNEDSALIGTAKGRYFDKYDIYAGEGLNPASWKLLKTSTTPVDNGTLISNISNLPPGDATLKLEVQATGPDGKRMLARDMVAIKVPDPSILMARLLINGQHAHDITPISIVPGSFINFTWSSANGQSFGSSVSCEGLQTGASCAAPAITINTASGTMTTDLPIVAGNLYRISFSVWKNGEITRDTAVIYGRTGSLPSFTVNGAHEITAIPGMSLTYNWSSSGGTSYRSYYTSNNPSVCGGGYGTDWIIKSAFGTITEKTPIINGCSYVIVFEKHIATESPLGPTGGDYAASAVVIHTQGSPPSATLSVNGVAHGHISAIPGDDIKYTWSSTVDPRIASSAIYSSEFTTSNPAVCGSGPWQINTASGTITEKTPIIADCTYTVTFKVQVPSGETASDSIIIDAVPPHPTASLTVNGLHSITASPGTSFTYRWNSTNGSSYSSSFTTNTPAVCGSGPWQINTASGTITETTPVQPDCIYTVTFTVTNSSGIVASDSIMIFTTPSNLTASLTVNGVHSITVTPGTQLTYRWDSKGGLGYSSSFMTKNPAVCGSGPWQINTASGTITEVTPIKSGCVYAVTFIVTGINGRQATDSIDIITQ